MAFMHGSKAKFYLGTAATPTVLVDISAYLSSISLPRNVDTAETSTFGNTFKTYVPGLSDATISGDVRFDPTIDAQLAALVGVATVDWRWRPQGVGTGLSQFDGSAFLTSYEIGADIGDVGGGSFGLQIITAVTRSVQ